MCDDCPYVKTRVTVYHSARQHGGKHRSGYITFRYGVQSQAGLTALEVARMARQTETTSLLEAFLKAEPAHEVITEGEVHVRIDVESIKGKN